MDLAISTDAAEKAVVVRIEGDLDVYTAPQMKYVLREAFESRAELVVLDLCLVHFIDSTALGVLASALEEGQSSRTELRLVMDDPYLLKIFRITGFDGVFAIYSGLTEALAGTAA